jgi:hypothetical protein
MNVRKLDVSHGNAFEKRIIYWLFYGSSVKMCRTKSTLNFLLFKSKFISIDYVNRKKRYFNSNNSENKILKIF